MEDKKLMILSVSVGEGHDQVSRALQEELEEQGYHAEIVDIFQFMNRAQSTFFKKLYFQMIYHFPFIWKLVFSMTNNSIFLSVLQPFLFFWWKDFKQYCQRNCFTIIISTHPLATFLGARMKKYCHDNPLLFAVLSDFSTHKMSLSRGVDAIFVAEKEEGERLKEYTHEMTVYSYGIPLRKVWDDKGNKRELRMKLQLPLFERIVIISGGR